jgi:flagellum-specific ATP synthase
VFAALPRLLERAGTSVRGSITGLYTVLVDGDDMNEPIADAVRGILDGHCVLSRELAHRNHYPAIDILASVSRLSRALVSSEVLAAGGALRESLATYRTNEDLITVGAYGRGTDPRIDAAIDLQPRIDAFLRQGVDESVRASIADDALVALVGLPLDG